jgi:hypothetical protein
MLKQFREVAQEKLKHFWDKHICADMPLELYVFEDRLDNQDHCYDKNGPKLI